jgi:hypothetical protein
MTLTYPQVVAEFEALVAADPEHVYQLVDPTNCLYVHPGGKVGCIVAHWLHYYHDVSLYVLDSQEGLSAADAAQNALGYRFEDEDVVAFLDRIQSYQDALQTWGQALLMALEYMQDAADSAAVARKLAVEEAKIQL